MVYCHGTSRVACACLRAPNGAATDRSQVARRPVPDPPPCGGSYAGRSRREALEKSMQIAEKVGSTDADAPARPASGNESDYTQGRSDANGGAALDADAKGLTELLHALQAMRVGDFS